MSSDPLYSTIKRRVTLSKHRRAGSSSSATSASSAMSDLSSSGSSTPSSPPSETSMYAPSGITISAPITTELLQFSCSDLVDLSAYTPSRPPPVPPRSVAPWRTNLLELANSYSGLASPTSSSSDQTDLDIVIGRLADPRINERQALGILRAYIDNLHTMNVGARRTSRIAPRKAVSQFF